MYLHNQIINLADILLDRNFKILDDSEYVLDLSRLSQSEKCKISTSDQYQLVFKHSENGMGWGPSGKSGYFGIHNGKLAD